MPPPPPPSKSYLLVLDDESDSEDEAERYGDVETQRREFALRQRLYQQQQHRNIPDSAEDKPRSSDPPPTRMSSASLPSLAPSSVSFTEDDYDDCDYYCDSEETVYADACASPSKMPADAAAADRSPTHERGDGRDDESNSAFLTPSTSLEVEEGVVLFEDAAGVGPTEHQSEQQQMDVAYEEPGTAGDEGEQQDEEMEDDDDDDNEEDGEGGADHKRKRKKKKKKKKKKRKGGNSGGGGGGSTAVTATVLMDEGDAGGGDVDDDDSGIECDIEALAGSNAGAGSGSNRRKKKKKKKKRGKRIRGVQFGSVQLYQFSRCLGTHSVPGDGGWPLGLSGDLVAARNCGDAPPNSSSFEMSGEEKKEDDGEESIGSGPRSDGKTKGAQDGGGGGADITTVSLDQYEEAKQGRLRDRWEALLLQKKVDPASDRAIYSAVLGLKKNNKQEQQEEDGNEPLDAEKLTARMEEVEFETRQWDYRRKMKNPLFGLVSERQRMKLLLEDSGTLFATESGAGKKKKKSGANNTANNNGGGNGSSGGGGNNNGGGGKKKNGNPKKHQHQHNTRSKSGSSPSSTRKSRSSSSGGMGGDVYNDAYTQVEVIRVRNELEKLRNGRSGEGSVGCTCRKLHVYIPPPNAGKKAAHRRMNVNDVKKELRKRNMLPDGAGGVNGAGPSRDELERMLHDAVENEPCCGPQSDCPCYRNGIGCQADTCSCWYASHQTHAKQKKAADDAAGPTTEEEIVARCGNANGMYSVDFDRIDRARKPFLGATGPYCLPVGAADDDGTTAPVASEPTAGIA